MPRFLRQFGLRSLLLFCTLAAVCFGLWRWHMSWVDRQFELAAQIGEKDGQLRWETWGPAWLHETFGSRYFSQIVMVDWHRKRIKDEDLELLREISTLEILYLAGNPITDDGIAVLDDLPKIKRLALWSTRLTDESLKHVGKLKQLEALDIHYTQMTENGLAHLRGLKQLSLLRQDLLLTDQGIGHLQTMPNVQLERIQAEQLSEESLRWVGTQRGLTSLQLKHPQGDRWADGISAMTKLRQLQVSYGEMGDEQLRAILRANPLVLLELENVPVGDAALIPIEWLGSLRRVSLSETNVTPEAVLRIFGSDARKLELSIMSKDCINTQKPFTGPICQWQGEFQEDEWQHLALCHRLQELTIAHPLPNAEHLQGLASLKSLQSFTLHGPGSDALVGALAKLPHLSFIALRMSGGITANGYGQLKGAANLGRLYLSQCQINDEQFAEIAKISQLGALLISTSSITDAGIQPITSLGNLNELYLFDCPNLTGEALRTVSVLSKLQFLQLQNVPVDDIGLAHLHGMPKLQIVRITGTRFNPQAMSDLLDSLPARQPRKVSNPRY
ncbi:hypothetical protein [Blastopirellula marina]|uniref:Leucine Rich repeats (2 copies) n=1 Tax=Blastopirellula marina TaxID=124 RepID=A0A2S8GLU3_9BACT|nr:hypothetical protein [Blastopirellula marina]PQO45291.1 hypothetical protein C5Y93_15160 [Blastopirellula marina]